LTTLKFKRSPDAAVRAHPLASIFHPLWSSSDDHTVITSKASGDSFSVIARKMGRKVVAVEQRWQRLRKVKNVELKLRDYGLSDHPYALDGGVE
jgi:hypothetical protein